MISHVEEGPPSYTEAGVPADGGVGSRELLFWEIG